MTTLPGYLASPAIFQVKFFTTYSYQSRKRNIKARQKNNTIYPLLAGGFCVFSCKNKDLHTHF